MNEKADPNNSEPSRDVYAAALKRERAHYVSTGESDRLAAVDAELARVGSSSDTPVERAVSAAPERAEAVKAKPARKPAARKRKDA